MSFARDGRLRQEVRSIVRDDYSSRIEDDRKDHLGHSGAFEAELFSCRKNTDFHMTVLSLPSTPA